MGSRRAVCWLLTKKTKFAMDVKLTFYAETPHAGRMASAQRSWAFSKLTYNQLERFEEDVKGQAPELQGAAISSSAATDAAATDTYDMYVDVLISNQEVCRTCPVAFGLLRISFVVLCEAGQRLASRPWPGCVQPITRFSSCHWIQLAPGPAAPGLCTSRADNSLGPGLGSD